MSLYLFLASLPALLAGVFSPPVLVPVRRVLIRDEIIIHIPVRPAPPPALFDWEEHKGPKCLPSGAITGAVLSGKSSIDFLLVNHGRIRARMDEDCTALDFYGGFYVSPKDDNVCADRDEIRSRMGGSCRIDKFKLLVPQSKR